VNKLVWHHLFYFKTMANFLVTGYLAAIDDSTFSDSIRPLNLIFDMLHVLFHEVSFYKSAKSLIKYLQASAPDIRQGLYPPPGLVQAEARYRPLNGVR